MGNKYLLQFSNDIKEIIELKDKSDYLWYGTNKPCYLIRFSSFAPVSELAQIKDGKYTDNELTGYIHGNGNLGTNSMLIERV